MTLCVAVNNNFVETRSYSCELLTMCPFPRNYSNVSLVKLQKFTTRDKNKVVFIVVKNYRQRQLSNGLISSRYGIHDKLIKHIESIQP